MFNQYPYLNLNDLNLDFILKAIREMKYEVTNFVSINAIKYADPIQWNITSQYEKNTIVIDPVTGTAYISVAPVPSGVALTRPEYWTVVFDLGSFVTRAAQNFTSRWESDTTTTATFPTTTGGWLVWGDVLYRALTNITAGDTYVVGSNIEHFTIEDLYNAYLNTIAQILNIIGDLDDLHTVDKSSIVAAINENFDYSHNIKIYTPEMFGAVGDGITDDTEALETALNSGVTVLSGTYYITRVLFVKYDVIGRNATIKYLTSGSNQHACFRIDVSNVKISGINFDGLWNGTDVLAGEEGHAIAIHGGSFIAITNCTMKNCYGDGIYFRDDANHCTVENVDIKDTYRNAFAIVDGHDIIVRNCTFDYTGNYSVCIDMECNTGFNCDIYNIVFENVVAHSTTKRTLLLFADTDVQTPTVHDMVFKDCSFTCDTSYTIETGDNSAGVTRIVWDNCTIVSGGSANGFTIVGGDFTIHHCKITADGLENPTLGILGVGHTKFYNNIVKCSERLVLRGDYIDFRNNIIDTTNGDGSLDGVRLLGFIGAYVKNNIITSIKAALYVDFDATKSKIFALVDNVFNKTSSATTYGVFFKLPDSGKIVMDLLDINGNSFGTHQYPIGSNAGNRIEPSFQNSNVNNRHVYYSSQHPSVNSAFTGLYFHNGDIVLNSDANIDEAWGWICTAGGTSPTWTPLGTLLEQYNPADNRRIYYTTVFPSNNPNFTGVSFKKGDLMINADADVGENWGWICTAGGTTPTWSPLGLIST